jgi:hypothetical protein
MRRKIDHTAYHKGTAIRDPHDDGFASFEISNPNRASQRQSPVSGGERRRFARSAVKGCEPYLSIAPGSRFRLWSVRQPGR